MLRARGAAYRAQLSAGCSFSYTIRVQDFLRQPCASDGRVENLKSIGLARRRGKQQRREIRVSLCINFVCQLSLYVDLILFL